MFTPTMPEVIKNDNSNIDQKIPVLRNLLTSWFVLPSLSLIILGAFQFLRMGLFFFFLCGDSACQPLALSVGFLNILFLIVFCLTPGLLLVMLFRGLYRLPMIVLGIGTFPLVLNWILLLLNGKLTIERMFQLNQEGFAHWLINGTSTAILLIIYITTFLIFKLLSSLEIIFINILRKWVLTTILLLAIVLIVIGIIAPQAFVVAEKKLHSKLKDSQMERFIIIILMIQMDPLSIDLNSAIKEKVLIFHHAKHLAS